MVERGADRIEQRSQAVQRRPTQRGFLRLQQVREGRRRHGRVRFDLPEDTGSLGPQSNVAVAALEARPGPA